jgi:hypothetical protein
MQRRGTTVSPLIIPSRIGHRRTLKDIFIKESTGGGQIDISVGNTTKLRIRANLAQAILLQAQNGKMGRLGFMGVLATMIPEFPFPTATQDEDITITYTAVGASALTRIDAYFEDITEGDLTTRSLPGGSESKIDFMVLNMYNNALIDGTETYFFDNLDVPIGASPFSEGSDLVTGGRRMSAGEQFTLYALAADVPSPGGTSRTTRTHIFDEFIELFTSENNEGLFVDPTVVNELAFDLDPAEYFSLPTPYVFASNRLFNFKGDFTHDGANDAAAESQKIFLIGIRERIGGA